MGFLPREFIVPAVVETARFRLRSITIHDAFRDYDAVMSSRAHLWERFGAIWGWPAADLSLEQNIIDLAWHQKEFQLRSSFDFAVMSLDETRLLGCVYVDPPHADGTDADATVQYRNVRVTPLRSIGSSTVTPIQRAPALRIVERGRHTLHVEQLHSATSLRADVPLGDCNRSDGRGFASAGLGRFRMLEGYEKLNNDVLVLLTDVGFEPPMAQRIYDSLNSLLVGWLAREESLIAVRQRLSTGPSGTSGRLITDLAAAELQAPADERFEFLIHSFLGGMPDPLPTRLAPAVGIVIDIRDDLVGQSMGIE